MDVLLEWRVYILTLLTVKDYQESLVIKQDMITIGRLWHTLGEQGILNKEIYAQGTTDDDNVFGYQEIYAEYRYKPSMLTGKMRSNVTGSLDSWHLAQDFSSLPSLNASFIEENSPVDRVIAINTEPQLLLDMYFDLKCARPMPTYGTPLSLSRF